MAPFNSQKPSFCRIEFDEAPENLDACVARYEAMLDACGVPEISRRKIYGETLAKILGIKVRA
jgi:hypothetical protein